MPGPIKPKDVAKRKHIPEAVFEVFNDFISRKWDGHKAVIEQETVASAVAAALGCAKHEVYDSHYLDIEDAYRKAGWKVEYDKPGYNETYPATFTFRKKRSS